MKVVTLMSFIVLIAQNVSSQTNLQAFDNERAAITKKGMFVLGSWGTVNIIVGAIGQSSSSSETKYFHQMNLIWGAVNLAIALPTYLSLNRQQTPASLAESVKQQANIEKTFLFNAGLDLVYITGGFYCKEKSNSDSKHDLYRGYGNSLLVQGGGLLMFDITMYLTHVQHGKKLYKILSSIQFSGNSIGLLWKL
jgi:hypothetical protein